MDAAAITSMNGQFIIWDNPGVGIQTFIDSNEQSHGPDFKIGIIDSRCFIEIMIHVWAHFLNDHPFGTGTFHHYGLPQIKRFANQIIDELLVFFVSICGVQNHGRKIIN